MKIEVCAGLPIYRINFVAKSLVSKDVLVDVLVDGVVKEDVG